MSSTFGVTPQGFNMKRLEEISAETADELRSELGDSINLDPRGPLGQIKDILDEQSSQLWELAQGVYDSQYPETAEGVSLDNIGDLNGIKRLAATKSRVTGRISGDVGTVIPIGFIASVSGNASARFDTINSDIIHAGIDEVQKVAFSAVPTSGSFKLNFEGQVTNTLAFNVSAATVQTELNALSNLSAVTVTGNVTAGFIVTFTGADGQKPQPMLTSQNNVLASPAATITITEEVAGFLPFVDIIFDAENTGPIESLAGTLVVIETPLSGVDSITNLEDAVLGRDIESDTDYRLRRKILLRRSGTATLEGIRNAILNLPNVMQAIVIENELSVPDIDGRPPKSFEAYAQGGDDAQIAQAIFLSKAGGIQPYGTETEIVQDSQGMVHNISFSRPTTLDIYIIVNITKNTNPVEGSVYPADGDAQVEASILDFVQGYRVGQDIIVNLFSTPINTVPGVFGIEFLVGIAPSPTLSNNISIGPTELASFDSSRILVNS